eukprot:3762395-Pleurochrysis_carterae.AAC.1
MSVVRQLGSLIRLFIMARQIGCVEGGEGSTVQWISNYGDLLFRQHSHERTSYLEFERNRYESFRSHPIFFGGGDGGAIELLFS